MNNKVENLYISTVSALSAVAELVNRLHSVERTDLDFRDEIFVKGIREEITTSLNRYLSELAPYDE